MRLDKRSPGLAFGSPASRRCAEGTPQFSISNFREYCNLFSISSFESTELSVLFFFNLYRRSITWHRYSLIQFRWSYLNKHTYKPKSNPGRGNILSGYFTSPCEVGCAEIFWKSQETVGKWNKEDKDGKETARIRAYARSVVGFRRRSNHQYGKQDRAYMRLDKRRSGLAFGSPASRRCAAGTRRKLQKVIVVSTVLSVLIFKLFVFDGSIYQYLLSNIWSESIPIFISIDFLNFISCTYL